MLTTVKKWGNSASIRIPSLIMDAAKLNLDDEVDIREEGGRVNHPRHPVPRCSRICRRWLSNQPGRVGNLLPTLH